MLQVDSCGHQDRCGDCTAHRIFHIQEIVSLICEELHEDWALPALASLARTCKFLHLTATEILWHDLPTFLPLVSMMPADLWEVTAGSGLEVGSHLNLKRPLLLTDWETVEPHLRLVRTFGFRRFPYGRGTTNVAVFQALEVFSDHLPLFPNLRRLDWSWANNATFPYISLFLVPSLTTIYLALKEPVVVCLSLLATLHKWCPDIRDASFETNTDALARAALSVVSRWTNLAILDIDAVSPEVYIYLATLPTLHKLSIRDLDLPWDSITTQLPNRDGFANLQELQVYQSTPESCILMLSTMSSPLTVFGFESNEDLTSTAWEEIHNLLRDRCDPRRSLEICIDSPHNRADQQPPDLNNQDYRLSLKTISPLLTLGNLTSVTVDSNFDIDLDDEAVKEMAIAWPDIQCLFLLTKSEFNDSLRPTLLCLEYLAEYCPVLRELALTLDARSPAIDKMLSARPRNVCPLSGINLGYSPIENAPMVAAVLSGIFPNMTRVFTSQFTPGDMESIKRVRKWREVHKMLAAFLAVRKQEYEAFKTAVNDGKQN